MPRKTTRAAAGAHTVDITPEAPFVWGGPKLRRDPAGDSGLLAHAVVFTDGHAIAAVVSCDLPMIGRPHFLAMRELASLRSGIPEANIRIGANHVHVAPWLAPGFLISGPSPDPVYADMVVDRVAGAVAEARRKLAPARCAAGDAPAGGISFNRRHVKPDGRVAMVFSTARDPLWPPAGPADDDLTYVLFETLEGAPVGLITSFSAHNHVVGGSPVPGRPPGEFWHRDFGGRFGDVVRQRLDVPVPTAYLAGTCGNTSWQDPAVPPPLDGAAAAWRIGAKLAGAFLSHCEGAARKEITDLRFASKLVEVPDRPLAESHFCDDLCRGPEPEVQAFDRRRSAAEREMLAARGDATKLLVETAALSFSGLAVSSNPAELFVEFGLEIKRRSPFEVTLVSELTNGYAGYVPTQESFAQGGYETHRSVFTSRLAKDAGRIITEGCVETLLRCHRATEAPGAAGGARVRTGRG